ncbi:SEC-C domain-containing protein [Flavobacterium helocola]|uniref:SEC-C domain-containing protein n=1 Tax=Flavobacterium helocola TaxID=3139139 RepID=A0ABU9I7I4_9FLAO
MDLIKKISQFERDFIKVNESFPLLNYSWNNKSKSWVIKGDLDICDVKGVYWNTFNIAIVVPEGYPFCVPMVFEISQILPRDKDWHISDEGICCIDIEHNLIVMSRKGIQMNDFIEKKIYPYFANQLYKLEKHKYAGEEYGHETEGIIQYYNENLKIQSLDSIIVFIEIIIKNNDLTRNRLCPCNSGKKIKKCHETSIELIKTLGKVKILDDLKKLKIHYLKTQSQKISNEL